MKHSAEVAVVGVIGLYIALWLRDAGREVLLIDRNEPGSGASSGNAGVLANYACVPLGTPGVLRSLPQLLFQPSSPLSISLSALPRLTPWLLRSARASLADRARLARQLGDRIPLETERGYHLEFATPTALLRRPVCPIEAGLYLTPMTGRLRAAGTVERSNLRRPANPRRWQLIERGARDLFPTLDQPTARWLGFRPSLPDSLPLIGRSTRVRRVIYAFGHGHLGVTLLAIETLATRAPASALIIGAGVQAAAQCQRARAGPARDIVQRGAAWVFKSVGHASWDLAAARVALEAR